MSRARCLRKPDHSLWRPGRASQPGRQPVQPHLGRRFGCPQGSPAGLVYGHVAVHRAGDIGTEGSRIAKHHTHLRSRQPERRGRKTHDYLRPGPFWHALRAACARAGQRPSEQPHGRSCRRTSNREAETPLPMTGEAPEDVRLPDRARCHDLNRLTARGSVSTQRCPVLDSSAKGSPAPIRLRRKL